MLSLRTRNRRSTIANPRSLAVTAAIVALWLSAGGLDGGHAEVAAAPLAGVAAPLSWTTYFPPGVLAFLVILVALSALFSSCETAFLAIQKPRLRAMRQERAMTSRWVVRMLDDPGHFLTTILVGNMLVNTLIGVVMGSRLSDWLEARGAGAALAYTATVGVCTVTLLVFGEVLPKVFAMRARESYARAAVLPLIAADRLLAPLRIGLLRITDFLFQITHFSAFHAAPYITDEELKSVLADDQTPHAIKEEGRQMIRRILEFHDVSLREILIPRPDVVALPEEASIAEAHEQFREFEFSRIPIYREDLDHIVGILFAKDLLPSVLRGERDRTVRTLARPAHFVPETMSVQQFIRNVQRQRSHMAVVVDEYGGTAGIITLHDAIEQVVGNLRDEDDEEPPLFELLPGGGYRVKGSLSLDDLSELLDVPLEDEEHNTVAGFLMARMEKMPNVGDTLAHSGVRFTVERMDGKRADDVVVEIVNRDGEEAS